MEIRVPEDVRELGNALERSGYEWYLVGGCVRDSLLGKTPHDYDVATNATPEEMKQSLGGFRYFETGIRHGTLSVLTRDRCVEVTTYRTDGDYIDARHPKSVTFVSSIAEDLGRRDFTVNALAFHPVRGMVDICGGAEDLNKSVLRAVGAPEERFREDALRILRALRFSATLGFAIHEDTARAICENAFLLKEISVERIWAELIITLCGKDAVRVLREYKEVFFFLMPEMAPMDGCEQKNPYHIYDVWEHSLAAMAHTEPDAVLRCAALWHDIGKPAVFSLDDKGVGHFYGHAKESARSAEAILRRMKTDKKTKEAILRLVEDHDRSFGGSEKALRRYVGRTSLSHTKRLIALQKADVWGQSPTVREERLLSLSHLAETLSKWEKEGECLSMKDLAVSGRDVMALGIPEGKKVGEALAHAFRQVLSGEWPNEKEILLEKIAEYEK